MEILNHGKTYKIKQFTKEITCTCEAFLKIDIEDLKYKEQKLRDQNGDYIEQSVYVICPECNNNIFLLDLSQDIVYYLNKTQNQEGY
jgi:hypothetical protein